MPPGRDSDALKRTLLSVATSAGFDVSLQRESLYRRSKRLVVLDMDSTLIRIEVIDELARAAGVGDAVSKITERAMQGEMDYDESLRQRVGLLAGLDVKVQNIETGAGDCLQDPLIERRAESLVVLGRKHAGFGIRYRQKDAGRPSGERSLHVIDFRLRNDVERIEQNLWPLLA